MGGLIGVVVLLLVLGGIGAVIFFAVRGGTGEVFAFRNLLRAYLRIAYVVSLLVFMIGAVMTLTSAFSSTFGHDFSYSPYNNGYGPNSCPTGAAVDPKSGCSTSSQEDPRPKEDLIRGLSLLVAGAVFGAAHRGGQLAMESAQERSLSGLAKAEYLTGTVGFGLVSIIAVPAAAYSVLNFNLVANGSKGYSSENPGAALALALVFLPAWAYYLLTFVKRVRSQDRTTGAAVSPGTPPA
jgi:hypothetical protein